MTLYNYILYSDKNKSVRVGHAENGYISPLSWPSGSYLTNMYDVVYSGRDDFIREDTELPIDSVTILPPFAERNVLAVGKNYVEHAKEFVTKVAYDMGDKDQDPVPKHPVIFNKKRTSIVASNADIFLNPQFTKTVDYEGEIGVIIGKKAYQVKKEDALDYVWGYTLINDVSARERQKQHQQYFVGKSLDGFCPMGPISVPREVFDDNETIKFTTKVNGEVRQSGDTKDLIFSIPQLIETLSAGFTLEPGDVIASGTPAGVGGAMDPPRFLKNNDVVEIESIKIGNLVNRFVDRLPEQKPQLYEDEIEDQSNRFGTSTAYVDQFGDKSKPAIVFIHGIGESSSIFRSFIDRNNLYERYRVVLYDLEGHGLSKTIPTSTISIESLVSDLNTIYNQLGIDQAILVGHSIGSIIAGQFAAGNPKKVIKLILTGRVVRLNDNQEAKLRQIATQVRLQGNNEAALSESFTNDVLSSRINKETHSLVLEFQRALLRGTSSEGLAKMISAYIDASQRGQNEQVIEEFASQIIVGSSDLVIPFENIKIRDSSHISGTHVFLDTSASEVISRLLL